MAGLRNICRMFGGMTIQGVKWVWDYAAEEPVKQSEMPFGSERHAMSERAKARIIASVDGRRMAETTEELARGVARPARSARQAPRRPTLPSQTPAEESNND